VLWIERDAACVKDSARFPKLQAVLPALPRIEKDFSDVDLCVFQNFKPAKNHFVPLLLFFAGDGHAHDP
jgi:hypothetical protein